MRALDFKVSGFQFSGISAGIKKDGKRDLGLIYSDVPAQVAGLFTTSAIKASPGPARHGADQGEAAARWVVVNSGNAKRLHRKAGNERWSEGSRRWSQRVLEWMSAWSLPPPQG